MKTGSNYGSVVGPLREILHIVADNYPSGSRRDVRRWWCRWAAAVVSAAIAAFWAFWGAAETFHEGWYYRELWRNVALSFGQYFLPMLIVMSAGLLALGASRRAGTLPRRIL